MADEKKEMVNHPNHYGGDTEYECIKVLKAWNTPEEFIGFCKDNAIKYLCRSGKKDEVLQEYKKAAWYINTLIKYLEEFIIDLVKLNLSISIFSFWSFFFSLLITS